MNRQYSESEIVGYGEKGKTSAVSVALNKQLSLYNARAWNRSGSTINVGILKKLLSTKVALYYRTGATAYTLRTAAQLAAGTVVADTTNNNGFAIGGPVRFGLVGFTVSNTATGGTYALQYWNGSTWATLINLEVPTNLNTTGDKYIAFLPPVDWVVGSDSADLDSALYYVRFIHSTAPGDTGAINALWVGQFLDYYEGVGDNNAVELIFDSDRPFLLGGGEALFPYFSTANDANAFAAFYTPV